MVRTGLLAAALPVGARATDRIRLGLIGCGAMGVSHIETVLQRGAAENVAITAVSDVYQRRLTRAQGMCGGRAFVDYRGLLDMDEIDAVVIATPDHWHARMAIEALDAGKHVLVEKPLANSIPQALAVRKAARESKRVFQVGSQALSNDAYWKANAAIREGRIGKVTWGHVSYNRNYRECLYNSQYRVDATAGPDKGGEDEIDWDLWLGSKWGLAPAIPYNPEHFFRFRKYAPYNGGVASDLLYHKLAAFLVAVSGPNGEYPKRVSAQGGLYVEKDGRDTPDTFLMTVDFPSEWSLFLVSTLTNDSGLPERIYGKFGTMELDQGLKVHYNGEMGPEFQQKNGGRSEAEIPLEARRDMLGNFLDAIRGTAQPFGNVELACSTMVSIQLAVEAFRRQTSLTWDARQERISAAAA